MEILLHLFIIFFIINGIFSEHFHQINNTELIVFSENNNYSNSIGDNLKIEENGRVFAQGSNMKKSKTKKMKKNDKSFMEKMLPMMVMPFMISTSMIPMMLISLLGMLIKSAILAKIGIFLMLFNMFRGRMNQGGVSSQNIHLNKQYNDDVAMAHYGWQGNEEYGAYVNRRRRKK